MGLHSRHESSPPQLSLSFQVDSPRWSSPSTSFSNSSVAPRAPEYKPDPDLEWPFGKLSGLEKDDVREVAYELFFTSCRSSPGFGGQNALAFYSSHEHHGGDSNAGVPGSPGGSRAGGMMTYSKIKRALGLRTLKRMPSMRRASLGGGPSSPKEFHGIGNSSYSSSSTGISLTMHSPRTSRKRLTSAEIMRVQMRVTDQSDHRLRKTLMRTLVGQRSRRSETLILPLELIRHLKPSEFRDHAEYHYWQKRQLKFLETALILHPAVPLDQSNSHATRFQDILKANEDKALDTGKNSDLLRQLCSCVLSLAWRGPHGSTSDVCHWVDGYPLNLHIYVTLLQAIFDLKDDTAVLDEVDELIELMKKTWNALGINRSVHNVCLTWIFFQQYVLTEQTEQDLLGATLNMLVEVENDAKNPGERQSLYASILGSVLNSVIGWSEKKLLNYQEAFSDSHPAVIENLLPLALNARKILDEDAAETVALRRELREETGTVDPSEERVGHYISSSLTNAFAKVSESMNIENMQLQGEKEASEALIDLAQATEELAGKEKENYSNTLKKWHLKSAAVAAVTLHTCYGKALQEYLAGVSTLSNETIEVLNRAGKLENFLVQMVVEDTVECEDGGKSIVRAMDPYEVDSIILRLLRKWIDDRLRSAKDSIERARETETWNPKSKAEPFAQSAVELTKMAKDTIHDFFEIPVGHSDELVQYLADGVEGVIREYLSFVASCGTKQSYVPIPPPLTRCNRDSKIIKLWKRAGCNAASMQELHHYMEAVEGHNPRPTTSRGTQRLYIRLNTLYFLLSELNSLSFPKSNTVAYFELARASMHGAINHVAEVSGYRLIFLDSNSVFYESLYVFNVTNSRIRATLRILKQNLALLGAILIDHAQSVAMKEVMKAAFEAYLMVLLAGGSNRFFYMTDYEMIEEDFESLKQVFCTSGSGLVCEDGVDKEAEAVEGVVQLMGQSTEKLIEDFSSIAGERLPMPPTTGHWNRSDPNTILRVLCHRNDRTANQYLKRTFQLPKSR